MSAVLALLALGLQAAPGRFRQAEIEVRGPLESLSLELPGGSSTLVRLDIGPGEVRTLVVPLCAPADAGELVLREEPECAGEARWYGWSREGLAEVADEWDALPRGLRERPFVAPGERVPGRGPQPEALAFAAAAVVLVLALRRRPLVALASSLAGAALVGAFAIARDGEPERELRVLEGDGPSGLWLAVDSGWERLRAPVAVPLRLEVDPPAARVAAEARLSAVGLEQWELRARGARLRRIEALDPGPRGLSPGENRWGALEELWTRSGDGRWSHHGRWEPGEALPPGEQGDPPGALNPALPMGAAVLVGRLAPGAFGSAGLPPGRAVWIRWVGEWSEDSRVPR